MLVKLTLRLLTWFINAGYFRRRKGSPWESWSAEQDPQRDGVVAAERGHALAARGREHPAKLSGKSDSSSKVNAKVFDCLVFFSTSRVCLGFKSLKQDGYFFSHFWPLLKYASFLEAAGPVSKIGLNLKLNHHNHVFSLSKVVKHPV